MSKRLLFLFAGVALLAAACGGGEKPATVNDDGEVPELTQSATSADGVTVRYPAGWADPITQVGVFAYTSADAQSGITQGEMKKGEIFTQTRIIAATEGISLLEAFFVTFSPIGATVNVALGEPEAIQVGDVEGLFGSGSNDDIGLLVALLPLGEQSYVSVVVFSNGDEAEQQEPLILAMLESIEYAG